MPSAVVDVHSSFFGVWVEQVGLLEGEDSTI
jgi:hypothetical protein